MYEVQAGDTPARIAQAFTGDASRGAELVAANPYKPRTVYGGGQLGAVGQVSFRELSRGRADPHSSSLAGGACGAGPELDVSFATARYRMQCRSCGSGQCHCAARVSEQPAYEFDLSTVWYSGGWYYSACVNFTPAPSAVFPAYFKSSSSPNYGTNGVQAPCQSAPQGAFQAVNFQQGVFQSAFIPPPQGLLHPFIVPPGSIFRPPTANNGGSHLTPINPFPHGPSGPIQGVGLGADQNVSTTNATGNVGQQQVDQAQTALATGNADLNAAVSSGQISDYTTAANDFANAAAAAFSAATQAQQTDPNDASVNNAVSSIVGFQTTIATALGVIGGTSDATVAQSNAVIAQAAATSAVSTAQGAVNTAIAFANSAPSPASPPSTPPRTVPVGPSRPVSPVGPVSPAQPIQPATPAPIAPSSSSSSSSSSVLPWVIGGLAVVIVGGLIYASSRHKTVLTKTSSHAPRRLRRRLKHARRPSHRRLRRAGRRRR